MKAGLGRPWEKTVKKRGLLRGSPFFALTLPAQKHTIPLNQGIWERKHMEKTKVIIGVDGGGSKSIGVAADGNGHALAVFRGKGINYYQTGMDQARRNLKEIVDALLSVCGGVCGLLSVGMPALDTTADEATVGAFAGDMFDPQSLILESDACMTLEGMTGGDRGMIVICGTGSMALLDDGNRQTVAGGWGYLLGDSGSGYSIAMAGLRAAIRHWEGTGPETGLGERALAHFALNAPRDLIALIYDPACGPDTVARFAGEVFSLAASGDGEANRVLADEMQGIAWQAASLLGDAPGVEKVGLYGGIFHHQPLARRLFADALYKRLPGRNIRIVEPEYPPEIGAVIRGFKRLGTLNAERLANLKNTYEKLTGAKGDI